MIIYPAIDLMNGQVVRLKQGDFKQEMIFNNDPLAQAKEFERAGATWLHVVDLDGAKDGYSVNGAIVRKIKENTKLKVQLGGGLRTIDNISKWLEVGIERVIVGTMAVENPTIVGQAIAKFGTDRIVVGIDVKNGRVATHGWTQESGHEVLDFAQKMVSLGVSQILYTDISRDGMLGGTDLVTLQRLVKIGGVKVIASGGVGTYEDLERLKEVQVAGVIIGQALYQGILSLPKIINKVS